MANEPSASAHYITSHESVDNMTQSKVTDYMQQTSPTVLALGPKLESQKIVNISVAPD